MEKIEEENKCTCAICCLGKENYHSICLNETFIYGGFDDSCFGTSRVKQYQNNLPKNQLKQLHNLDDIINFAQGELQISVKESIEKFKSIDFVSQAKDANVSIVTLASDLFETQAESISDIIERLGKKTHRYLLKSLRENAELSDSYDDLKINHDSLKNKYDNLVKEHEEAIRLHTSFNQSEAIEQVSVMKEITKILENENNECRAQIENIKKSHARSVSEIHERHHRRLSKYEDLHSKVCELLECPICYRKNLEKCALLPCGKSVCMGCFMEMEKRENPLDPFSRQPLGRYRSNSIVQDLHASLLEMQEK